MTTIPEPIAAEGAPKQFEIRHRWTDAVLYTGGGESLRDVVDHVLSACEPSGDCLVWTLSTVSGYGRFQFDGRRYHAHRVMWEAQNGPIPDEMLVLHRCDDRRCVNPNHLFLGTHADNMADMAAKGRSTRGRKLTAEHRRKVAIAGRGRIKSAETREKIAAGVRAFHAARAAESADSAAKEAA